MTTLIRWACAVMVPLAGVISSPAFALSSETIDAAAVESAVQPLRAEVAAACGRPIDLRVDVPSLAAHKFSSGAKPAGTDDVLRTMRSLVPYVVDLCSLEPAMAKRVTAVLLRSDSLVDGGTQNYTSEYIDRESVGYRYVVNGKAGLRGNSGTYMFEAGVISVYTWPGVTLGRLYSEFDKTRRERPNPMRAIPGLGTGAGTALNVSDRERSKSKLGQGCVAIDGEEICGSGTLEFSEAVEAEDCSQSSGPGVAIDCRKRLAAIKDFTFNCKLDEQYKDIVAAGGNHGYTPSSFFIRVLKQLESCPNGGNQLVNILFTRWDYNSQTLKVRSDELTRTLDQKVNKAIVAACGALRTKVIERDLLSPENRDSTYLTEFLYRCAVVAGGSLAPYSWKTKSKDIAFLNKDRQERRAGDDESRAERAQARAAEANRIRNLPLAHVYCQGRVRYGCIPNCKRAKLCR